MLRCLATEQQTTEFQIAQESGVPLTTIPLSCAEGIRLNNANSTSTEG